MKSSMNMIDAREAMVDNQIRPSDVVGYPIIEAFLSTKREHFIPDGQKSRAYGEFELEYAPGRLMMTPRSFAKLVQMADPKPHEEILLIGAALGYEAAIISQLCDNVIAVGRTASAVSRAQEALAREGYDNAVVIKGRLKDGAEKSGPYDLIIFNGAVEEIPKKMIEQLKENGRMAAIFHNESVFTGKLVYPSGEKLFERSHFQASAPLLPDFEKRVAFAF